MMMIDKDTEKYLRIGVRCTRDKCTEKQCKHHACQMFSAVYGRDLYGEEVCLRYLEALQREGDK